MAIQKNLKLHHVAILMLMIYYDERKMPEIAQALGFQHRESIPKYYKMDILPHDLRRRACEALGYSESVFDTGDLISAVRDIQAQNEVRDARMSSDRALIAYLEKEVSALRAEAEANRADRESCRAKIDAITEKLRAAEQENVFLRSRQSRN